MRRMRRRDPSDLFDQMQNMMEEMAERGLNTFEETFQGSMPVDVKEEDGEVVITADMPGVEKEDISLTADEHGVEIVAERDTEIKEENEKYVRNERRVERFNRSIAWPAEIDTETIEASYEDGVLTVTAEKEEDDSGNTIEIQ